MNKEEALRRIEAAEKEIAEAKKALEQNDDEPKPGDWCVFWDDSGGKAFYNAGAIRKFKNKAGNYYVSENDTTWRNCRRITPEDFGWKLDGKPNWKDAPEWARYLAQDENGGWWWYGDSPKSVANRWLNGTRYAPAFFVSNWRETLERRPE